MFNFVLERCLHMVSIMGIWLGKKKKNKGWLIASIICSCISLGIMIERFFNHLAEKEIL